MKRVITTLFLTTISIVIFSINMDAKGMDWDPTDDLLTNFVVEGLEERLETDPLMAGGLFTDGGIQTADCFCNPVCNNICSPVVGE